jgi:hypothetical protein
MRSMIARRLGVAVLLVSSAVAVGAEAQVFQTDAAMTPLPQPVQPSEVNLITQSWARNSMTQSWKDPLTGAQLMMPITYGEYYSP